MSDSPSPTPDLPAILARADRLAAARAKATAGPWEIDPDSHYHIHGPDKWPVAGFYTLTRFPGEINANLVFVALARNFPTEEDVRAMVAEVERLREANQFLRDEIIKLSEQAAQGMTW